jgi:hypothetical protein
MNATGEQLTFKMLFLWSLVNVIQDLFEPVSEVWSGVVISVMGQGTCLLSGADVRKKKEHEACRISTGIAP